MKKMAIGGGDTRDLFPIDATWIRDRVHALRSRGIPVCVRILIESPGLNIILTTPGCPDEPSVERETRPMEQRLFDLWERKGMKQKDFEIDQLIAFIKEIEHL
jgi:hypothetical protein